MKVSMPSPSVIAVGRFAPAFLYPGAMLADAAALSSGPEHFPVTDSSDVATPLYVYAIYVPAQ